MEVVCGHCGAVNRVDPAREGPKCGRCKEALEPRAPGYPVPADDQTFDDRVIRAGLPVLVDFAATWCGPCKQMEPVLEQFAREVAGKVRVVKVDIDKSRFTAQKYAIRAVPTLVLFRGLEAGRLPGAVPLEGLRSFVGRYVS